MSDTLEEARDLLARVIETEAAMQPALDSSDPDVMYQVMRDRNVALAHMENEATRLLAALCFELAALRALVRAYAEAHDARTAHSAQMVRDERWFAERDELNNRVGDALTALRKDTKCLLIRLLSVRSCSSVP